MRLAYVRTSKHDKDTTITRLTQAATTGGWQLQKGVSLPSGGAVYQICRWAGRTKVPSFGTVCVPIKVYVIGMEPSTHIRNLVELGGEAAYSRMPRCQLRPPSCSERTLAGPVHAGVQRTSALQKVRISRQARASRLPCYEHEER
jgi:hypothetical protein